jgi:plastocyanin
MLRPMRVLVLFCLLMLALPRAHAAEWTVLTGDYYYEPAILTIAPGDSVTWVNVGFQQHDSTAADSSWASPLLFSEEAFTLAPGEPGYPFNQAREFPYLCVKHIDEYPGQTGIVIVASANLPPSVNITSPANGDGFPAPASFTITANATDSDGTVASVQFFVNGNPAGTSTGPTFSANVSSLAEGNYTLTATATDNMGATANANPVTITVTNPPVIVKFSLTTAISPVASGTLIVDPPQPGGGYNAGTVITLTASAANGFAFSNWSGSVSSVTNPLTITMDSAKSITANFISSVIATYRLTLSTNPAGGGTIEATPAPNGAGGTYLEGTVVTLTATPAFNFAFTNFSGDASSASNSVTLTMNGNKAITANFVESIVPTFVLTVMTNPPGAGTVQFSPPPNSPNGRYVEGTVVTLTATPIGTNAFTNWAGAVNSTSNRITIMVDSDKSVTANFVPIIPPTYTLTVNVSPTNGGTVFITPSPNSNGTYSANTTVALSAQPAPGFRFDRWTGAVASSNSLVLLVMNGNKGVTAIFTPLTNVIFSDLTGAWAGLLLDERETNYTTTGYIALRVSKTGAYRGTTTIGGMRNFVAGQFDRFGYAPFVVRRATLSGSLQINPETGTMAGTLTDGRKSPTLLLYRIVAPTNAVAFVGNYSIVIGAQPPVANEGAATIQILANGTVRIRGLLGDGLSFNDRTFITDDSHIPLFVPLKRGLIAGWLNLTEGIVHGDVRWFRLVDSRRLDYPDGFSIVVPFTGSIE